MNDMQIVVLMIEKAKKAGLLAEVVHAYGEYRARGDSIAAASTCALFDYYL
jgi:hypothetical protein